LFRYTRIPGHEYKVIVSALDESFEFFYNTLSTPLVAAFEEGSIITKNENFNLSLMVKDLDYDEEIDPDNFQVSLRCLKPNVDESCPSNTIVIEETEDVFIFQISTDQNTFTRFRIIADIQNTENNK
jgi:hypothetical protein